MRASIATVSLSGSLEEKLGAAAAAGFDGVEIFDNDLIASPLSPRGVGRFARDLGMAVELYQPFRDFEGVLESQFEANLRRAAAKLDVAAQLGAPLMLLCSNVATAVIDDDDLLAEQLRVLGDLAQERGVKIAYEALAWGRFVSTYDHAWSIVRQADHPAVGLCLDSFHMLSRRSSLELIEEIPGEKIFFAQVADAPLIQLDPLSWSRHYRLFPGQGDFDLVGWTAAIAKTGYAGPMSIEVFNDVFRQTDPRLTAIDGLRSLRYLEDITATTVGFRDGAVSPSLTRLTHSGPAEDFDYIRVAVPERHDLDGTFLALGFVHRGASGNGDDLWSQGDVRLIITTSGSDDTAPVGIVGIGFHLVDVEAASRRAGELLAHDVAPDPSPSSHVLRAPGSVRVGLSPAPVANEPDWIGRFSGATEPEPARSRAIDHVDHIALPQNWRTFDEAVLFYRSILGLVAQPSEDVADERGLVRSQVLANGAGTVRVVLNVLPTSVVESVAGGGARSPGHIALGSRDIFSTVRSLDLNGVPMLQLPTNYYDDLIGRFDLSPEYVQTLKALNIMYDRNSDGEFLQAYTETRDNVFFEIVQRLGDYLAFGASNSPVRRAAQLRSEHS
ncbi:sugar phosphate isomerase/epimerase and 4-hydroxyphenylpyruvate domain-containing protein [Lacisediminihabitans profunda]|uniref:3-dehydroshikimate dehydratase n=1 Tax=Lacisediminihabitans profunda TaxID=2594790 RepID=A0A5C8ULN4_9MICO|nr:sugar phosphate isomerase/epimerase and 4-hydroxyphenylpyruvate domain-containing protein [Lacisediminihabitans profunda]TXN28363.1 sugar phosphate isomerase/epimerase and 4-hydroxyphenylpyruvate domain-containing protein [Lacisediminihabitans profunda]